MKNRLSKIIKPKDNRTVMLAVDHGYFMGPTSGLENIADTVNPLLPYADTLMLTRGALRNYISPEIDVPIVLRVSGGTSILNDNLLHEGIIASMEDAVRIRATSAINNLHKLSPTTAFVLQSDGTTVEKSINNYSFAHSDFQ